MIVCIKHIDIEGPGTLGSYLLERDPALNIIETYKGDVFPSDIDNVDAVICLGGPMNVYQEEAYPFLKDEDAFIRRIVEKKTPFLGICLGSQLLAKALGAKVVKSPEKEIGWRTVELTTEAADDPLFSGVEKELAVFQWHEDTFELPEGAKQLVWGEECPFQAFRYGESAYGLQFHVEVEKEDIVTWSNAYLKKEEEDIEQRRRQMTEDFDIYFPKVKENADRMYSNFYKLIEIRKAEIIT